MPLTKQQKIKILNDVINVEQLKIVDIKDWENPFSGAKEMIVIVFPQGMEIFTDYITMRLNLHFGADKAHLWAFTFEKEHTDRKQ